MSRQQGPLVSSAQDYAAIMKEMNDLLKEEFNGDNVLDLFERYQRLIASISEDEVINNGNSGQATHVDQAEAIQQISEFTIRYKNVPVAINVIASMAVAALSIFGLYSAIHDPENDNQTNFNSSIPADSSSVIVPATVAASAVTLFGSLITLGSGFAEFLNNKKESKNAREAAAIALKEIVQSLKMTIEKSDLDKLISDLSAANKKYNPSRALYWRGVHETEITEAKINLAILDTDSEKHKKLNLFYAGIALVSFYSVKPNLNWDYVEEISRRNINCIKKYADIDESENNIDDIVDRLKAADLRLPTIYAKALYQLGRAANVFDWPASKLPPALQVPRDPIDLRKKLESACRLRELIDLEIKNDHLNPRIKFQEDYRNLEISDSLIFQRSGLIENKLATAEQEVEKIVAVGLKVDPANTAKVKTSLEALLQDYVKIQEGQEMHDGAHRWKCNEKKIKVLSNLVKLSDDLVEKEGYSNLAKTILFGMNAPTVKSLEIMIKEEWRAKTVLRSATKYASILQRCGKGAEADAINVFVDSIPDLTQRGFNEIKEETKTNQTYAQQHGAAAAALPQNSPAQPTATSAAIPAVTLSRP